MEKMGKKIRLLAVLLGAQALLAAGLYFTGPDLSATHADIPLLDMKGRDIDRITIEGPEGEKVVLARREGAWFLPQTWDFPVDSARIERFTGRLEGLRRGLPVATSESAMERFKVSDEAFERRLTLAHGDEALGVLYLGTSPGLRRVHARTGDDDAVYAVEFAVFDAPFKAEEWMDRDILRMPLDEIGKIEVAGLLLSREQAPEDSGGDTAPGSGGDPSWRIEPLADGETAKPDAAAGLARLVANLRIGSVVGRGDPSEFGLDEPALRLTVVRKDGQRVDYLLGASGKADGAHVLQVSTRPEIFMLPDYAANQLVDAARRESLVDSRGASTQPAGEDAAAPDAGEASPGAAPDLD